PAPWRFPSPTPRTALGRPWVPSPSPPWPKGWRRRTSPGWWSGCGSPRKRSRAATPRCARGGPPESASRSRLGMPRQARLDRDPETAPGQSLEFGGVMAAAQADLVAMVAPQLTQALLVGQARGAVVLQHPLVEPQTGRASRPLQV